MNNILKKVYLWMMIGLFVTFLTGYIVSISPNMIEKIFNSSIYLFLSLFEIVLVIILSARIRKMNPTTARLMFIVYSFVTGLTFSSIFIAYKLESILIIFLLTSIIFGVLSLIGYKTKKDLTNIITYLFVGLIAILICSIINLFIGNGFFEIITCSISVLVFLGFTIYDTQKIKSLSYVYDEDDLAIIGALQLYLDFINLFIDLIRIINNRKE